MLPTVPRSRNKPRTSTMPLFGKPKNPEEHRYYLLPGQGRGARKKHRQHILAGLIVGAIAGALVGALLWSMNRR
ncbi:MAG: hypothetical protein RIT19_2044 [Verrucomicrobiota bacterium]|jgi:hypothetical protein